LGIQIKAVNWGNYLCEHFGLKQEKKPSTSKQWFLAVSKTLFEYLVELESHCARSEIQLPRLEIWATDLLGARQNIFNLSHSRLRRFVRTLAQKTDESTKQNLTDIS